MYNETDVRGYWIAVQGGAIIAFTLAELPHMYGSKEAFSFLRSSKRYLEERLLLAKRKLSQGTCCERYNKWSDISMVGALKAVEGMAVNRAAVEYNVPKTTFCLHQVRSLAP